MLDNYQTTTGLMTGLSTKPLIVYVYTLQRIPRQTSHRLSSSPNLDTLVFWLGSDKLQAPLKALSFSVILRVMIWQLSHEGYLKIILSFNQSAAGESLLIAIWWH